MTAVIYALVICAQGMCQPLPIDPPSRHFCVEKAASLNRTPGIVGVVRCVERQAWTEVR
jgi:hypothetical protein